MQDLAIIKRDGNCFIDSRDVAAAIGKRHCDLLRDIERYKRYMEKSNERKIASVDFFVESFYPDIKGECRPCYLLTKMGCEMVANKLTGSKGILFTAAYVTKFNEMEQAGIAALRSGYLDGLNAVSRRIVLELTKAEAKSERIVGFLRRIYKPLGVAVPKEGNKATEGNTVYSIAKQLGVCTMHGKPYGCAVRAVIEQLGLDESHMIIIPHETKRGISLSVRYDDFTAEEVRRWLEKANWPVIIHGRKDMYHVSYANKA